MDVCLNVRQLAPSASQSFVQPSSAQCFAERLSGSHRKQPLQELRSDMGIWRNGLEQPVQIDRESNTQVQASLQTDLERRPMMVYK